MDLNGLMRGLLGERGRWAKVLSSPLTYSLLGGALRLTRNSWPLDAMYELSLLACSEAGRAFSGKVPVVWSTAFFPVELVWSLDLCPFSPEVAAAYLVSLGLGEEALSQGEQAGYSRDLCSFHRCVAGAAVAGLMPQPAALLASTQLCDGAPLLFQNMASLYGAPMLTLDIPYHDSQGAEGYVAGQLADIWQALADVTGRRPDRGRLAEAINFSNIFRERMCRVNELRRRVPAVVSGNDMLGFIYLFFAGQGSPETAEIARILAAEIEHRLELAVPEGESGNGAERCRLLWLHLKPYYSDELMNFVEQSGAVLAFEEMNQIYWPALDPAEPFLSLARKVLSHFVYKPLTERIRVIRELAGQYRIDGIVHFSHHGCRQTTGGAMMIKDALQEDGWPMLVLEGDCLDGRDETGGSLLTRMQAFLEILQDRKGSWDR